MGAHHGMEGGEQFVVVHPLPVVAPAGVDVGREPGIEMDGDQRVAHGPDRIGQPVVGVLQAGPRGVAAVVGAVEHVEDRPEGRLLEEGDVGMPPAGPVDAPVDGQHVRMLGQGRDDRMALGHRPELRGELGLLGGGEVLVAEEDHVMGVQGLPDLGHHRLAERFREVDAVDLGSDDRGQRPDIEPGGDGHGSLVMGSSVPHGGTRSTPARLDAGRPATVVVRPAVRRRTVRRNGLMEGLVRRRVRRCRGTRDPGMADDDSTTSQATQPLALVPGGEPAHGHRRGRIRCPTIRRVRSVEGAVPRPPPGRPGPVARAGAG